MQFPLVNFLFERGSRPASSKEETAALQYMENQFKTMNLDTRQISFPSFRNKFCYNAIAYALFPLASILYLDNHWTALLLASIGIILLRLDIVIWPWVNRLFSWFSHSKSITGRLRSRREPMRTFVITANVDSPIVPPRFLRWRYREVFNIYFLYVVDFLRVLQWLAFLIAPAFSFFNAREYVQMIWRLSLFPSILCLLVAGAYLFMDLYGVYLNCANDNLSGLRVLLDIVDELQREPLERVEVILAATGAGNAGMLGAHFLFEELNLHEEQVSVLHLKSIGSGRIVMVGSEGWSRGIYASDDLADLGYLVGSTSERALEVWEKRQRRSDASVARSAGYQALSIIGVEKNGYPEFLSAGHIMEDNLIYVKNIVIQMMRTVDHEV